MRRLALLLATSVLGTGCIVHDDSSSNPPCFASTITVRWPSFQLASGGVTPSCATAGVSYVDVYMNDQPVKQEGFACGAGGVTITNVPAGSARITVEGVAADGTTILLRDELTVSPAACGDVLVDAQPAEGTLQLAYSFTPNVCTDGGSYIWFSVYDQIARVVSAVADETANTTSYLCGDPIRFVVPAGAYTLQRIEEAVPSGGSYLASARNCNPTTFSVDRAAESIVTVALADASAFCP